MSAIENLLMEVQQEADRRQDEVIRRLAVNYPVGGNVCDFQALTSRLNKLKKNLKKTDEYVALLANRVKFVFDKLDSGTYLHLTEMLARRHQNYTDEEAAFLERVADLTREVGRVEGLIGLCVPCNVCIACKPRTTFRSAVTCRTKRTRPRSSART